MFRSGFKAEKLKPYLKMSIQRIALLKQKKTNHIKQSKKVVANLLKEGKDEKARIKTESIVREDFTIEAYEIIELLCELLLERVRLIAAEKECPYDMREAVCTLIYASNRTEIKELQNVSDQLKKKYGKEFTEIAQKNLENSVNERVVHKLSAQPPNAFLVLNYMKEIAKTFEVDWTPDESVQEQGNRFDVPMMAPTGATVTSGGGSGVSDPYKFTDGRIDPGMAPMVAKTVDATASPVYPSPAAEQPPAAATSKTAKRKSSKRSSTKKSGRGGSKGGGKGGSSGGGGGGEAMSMEDVIPPAPASDIDVNYASNAATDDDASTIEDDGERDTGAVPDFDELSKRFNALRKN